jgi:hypothetical protein
MAAATSDELDHGVPDLNLDLAGPPAALEAIAQLRPADSAQEAALRRALRDRRLMAHVVAAVGQWPALTAEQRDRLSDLLNPRRSRR